MSLEAFTKKRFLIVDELDTFCFSTKKTLKELGLVLVDTANNAQKVITGFENITYDVVLCNYELGKGKNGQELLEELRYRKLLSFGSLFFIISAEVEKGKVMGTVENEPDGYLVKPVSPRDLMNRLEKALTMKVAMQVIDTHIDNGQYHDAINQCDKEITEKSRYSIRCIKTKSWLLTKTGQFDLAVDSYQSILQANDFIWAEYGLAKIALKQENFAEAEKSLKNIIKKDPAQIEAMDLLAELYKKQNNFGKAQTTIEQAITLSPNALLRQKNMANLCVLNNKNEDAIQAYRHMTKLSDQSIYAKPEQTYEFVNFLSSQAKDEQNPNESSAFKEAFELLEKSEKRHAGNENISLQTKLMTANIHATVGNIKEAKALVEDTLNNQTTTKSLDASTLKVAASSLQLLGDQKKAEQYLEKAADAADDPELLSDIYDQLSGNISISQRKEAAAKNKEGIKSYSMGETSDAADILRAAQQITPRHISLNLNLAQVLLKLHKETNDEALLAEIKRYLHNIRHTPNHHKEYLRLAHIRGLYSGRIE